MKNAIVGNWQTSVAGALLGIVTYVTQNGTALPTTKEQFKSTAISLCFLLFGFLAKDANVGTKAA
jgi:uncharacterized membrane protein